MKPPPFRYLAPMSAGEAVEVLAEHGEEAKVLAGGQSLGPLLNFRLAAPSVLVDINRVRELEGEHLDSDGSLILRALTRLRDAERSTEVSAGWPLLTQALPHVAHPTIRNRGTIAGSLVHADPAAELPAVAVALGAEVTGMSVRGARTISASDLFSGFFTTSLEADELVTAVRLPKPPRGTGFAWHEFAPRQGDYALVGVAASVTLDDGRARTVRLVYTGVATTPQRLSEVEAMVEDEQPDRRLIESVAEEAASAVCPPSDLLASSRYRRRLVHVLTGRALREAVDRAQEA